MAEVVTTTATIEGGYRLASGEWRPSYPVKYAPLFAFPSFEQSVAIFKWLFSFPGFFWPWNCVYFALVYLSWTYAQPPLADFALPSLLLSSPFARAALALLARNLVLIWLVAGGFWHLPLYTLLLQGDARKYDPKSQAYGDDAGKFLFRSQVLDNVFWSCCSGVPIQTAFEVFYFFALATGRITAVSWADHPLYCLAWLAAIPFWRELHFYFGHRLLHFKALYPYAHYLHHKNSNPGPWSGLAMHPIEHVIYFSVVLIHFLVPSHPLHFIFNSQHTALTPAGGHHGYEGPIMGGSVPTGSYFHYLHHRYFECNYGESTLPLDWMFGTFRDGLPSGAGSNLDGVEHDSAASATKSAIGAKSPPLAKKTL